MLWGGTRELWLAWRRHQAAGRTELERLVHGEGGPPSEPPRWLLPAFIVALIVFPIAKLVDLRATTLPEWLRQLVLCAVAVMAGRAAMAGGRTDRRRVLECLGLLSRPRQGRTSWVLGPLLVSATVTLVIALFRSALDLRDLATLVILTAPGEEVMYRGGLLVMAYRAFPPPRAEALTALGFGLWHVGNALGESNEVDAVRLALVLGTVGFTMFGAVVFTWFRHRTGSLVGPIVAHMATNLPGVAW